MALDLEEIPTTPFLVPRFKAEPVGVDYLNLRQTNFDLMGECIPGINNATKLVRGYSLITWIYWVYPRILKDLGREEADRGIPRDRSVISKSQGTGQLYE